MSFSMPNIKLDGLTAKVRQWAPINEGEAPSAEDFGIKDSSVVAASLRPDLDIKTLDLRNILVEFQDYSAGMDSHFDIQIIHADSDEIDLNKENRCIRCRERT